MLGAEVYPVPAVAYENPANYNHQARDFAANLPNAIWTDQFDNVANANAHYVSTGPEIWEQTGGKVDGFICATGTGGTLAGTGRYLKEKSNGKESANADGDVELGPPVNEREGGDQFIEYANGTHSACSLAFAHLHDVFADIARSKTIRASRQGIGTPLRSLSRALTQCGGARRVIVAEAGMC